MCLTSSIYNTVKSNIRLDRIFSKQQAFYFACVSLYIVSFSNLNAGNDDVAKFV